MESPAVTLTKCSEYAREKIKKCLQRHFELLGGLDKFISHGDRVLLKPNMIAPRSRRHACQTDPAIILETARLVLDFGASPFVGDSPAWANATECVRKLRLEEPLQKLGVPVRQLNKPTACRLGASRTKIGISSVALDADAIINLPKFKSHQQLVATFAVKNMFGCVSGKRKALWHFTRGRTPEEFCRLLIDIYAFMKPAVTIIDAVIAMDRRGPIKGRARPFGWIIGGQDPIACEMLCSRLAGIEPDNVPIIRTAKNMKFGCADESRINILGDDFPADFRPDFKQSELIPVRFSLPHICRSIARQAYLLARAQVKS